MDSHVSHQNNRHCIIHKYLTSTMYETVNLIENVVGLLITATIKTIHNVNITDNITDNNVPVHYISSNSRIALWILLICNPSLTVPFIDTFFPSLINLATILVQYNSNHSFLSWSEGKHEFLCSSLVQVFIWFK